MIPADILDMFQPLQVVVKDSTDEAIKRFKNLVQKEKILSLYKERSRFEKPSVKRRRKEIEAQKRSVSTALREAQMLSGEWDKIQERKEAKRLKKMQERGRNKLNVEIDGVWL